MIEGTYDQHYGRPYVQGRLSFPRLGIDGYIDFLVDTGADVTTLHPRDGLSMKVPFDQLNPGQPSQGIGGFADTFEEPAVIMFADGRYVRLYTASLSVAKPTEYNMTVPSLLGQDILQHWRMVHDKPKDRLTFTVRRADLSMKGDIDALQFSPSST